MIRFFSTYFPLLIVLGCFLHPTTGYAQQTSQSDSLLAKIQEQYENLAFEQATATFGEIMMQYSVFSIADLAQVHLTYAKILFLQNRQEETGQQLRMALQLDSQLSLDTRQSSPKMIALFNNIKKETQNVDVDATENTSHPLRYVLVADRRPAAGLRSAILPGWGQYYKEEQIKGTILTLGFAVALISSVNTQVRLNEARNNYDNATTTAIATENYAKYNNWYKRRNFAALALGAVWTYSLIDALGHQNESRSTSSFQTQVSPTGIHFRYKF